MKYQHVLVEMSVLNNLLVATTSHELNVFIALGLSLQGLSMMNTK